MSLTNNTMSPPYPPQHALLGGIPTPPIDDPISAVFILLFLLSAITNMTIFQLNRRRGHKFILSAAFFGFSMTRITANSMRIVWAHHPSSVPIAIAASVFQNAGIIILFFANLIFAQRILRALTPRLAWGRPLTIAFRCLYASIIACFVMLVIALVYRFYTLDRAALNSIHRLQLFVLVYFVVITAIPGAVAIYFLLSPFSTFSNSSLNRSPEPSASNAPVESLGTGSAKDSGPVDSSGPTESSDSEFFGPDPFGSGSIRTKLLLLTETSLLLTFAAAFRAATAFFLRPIDDPAWFHHRAAFYTINYSVELLVVFSYVLVRFDRRFHIPDGSYAPGHYSNGVPAKHTCIKEPISAASKESDGDRSTSVSVSTSQLPQKV